MAVANSNKKIAKNTLMLYIRMLFTMAVSLYTSRVILNTLGVEDYGIYNAVGGIIIMISFLNNTMATATQRFLNFELGQNNQQNLQKVFCTSINLHIIIALLVILAAETIGLYFLYNHMTIPESRFEATLWVYHLSILSMSIMIISVPYNACIIAHERMDAFAYISVIEVTLKLLIVYLLQITNTDKLKLYAILLLCVQLIIRIIYGYYSKKHFPEAQFKFIFDKMLLKKMSSFAGWDLYGNASVAVRTQGVNLLFNIFFGPAVNAANGIATQVQSAVMSFADNITTAIRPQIIQSYSSTDYQRTNYLINKSSILIFTLLLTLSMPVIVETKYILQLWLKIVPQYAVDFCQLTLIFNLVLIQSRIIMIGIHATGKIKVPSICNGTLYLSVIPFSYFIFQYSGLPYYTYIFNIIVIFIGYLSNIFTLHRHFKEFNHKEYIKKVVVVSIIMIIIFYIIESLCTQYLQPSFIRVIFICCISILLSLTSLYIILAKDERRKIIRFIFNKK